MPQIYKIGTFVFLLITNFGASAQGFGGGIYAGMATTQINGDNLSGFNYQGANIGVFTDYKFTPSSKLQMELAFVQKGARETISDTSNFYKVRLNYFEIPILYVFQRNRFSLEIGPGFDFLVSSKEESGGQSFDSTPPFRNFNFIGIFGFSWHFTPKFHVTFRTSNSINLIRDSQSNSGTGPNAIQIGSIGQRNLALSFALVYRLQSAGGVDKS